MESLINKLKMKYVTSDDKDRLNKLFKAAKLDDAKEIKENIIKDARVDVIYVGNLTKQESIESS